MNKYFIIGEKFKKMVEYVALGASLFIMLGFLWSIPVVMGILEEVLGL